MGLWIWYGDRETGNGSLDELVPSCWRLAIHFFELLRCPFKRSVYSSAFLAWRSISYRIIMIYTYVSQRGWLIILILFASGDGKVGMPLPNLFTINRRRTPKIGSKKERENGQNVVQDVLESALSLHPVACEPRPRLRGDRYRRSLPHCRNPRKRVCC